MINKLKEIYRYRELILNLIFRDLADRYKRAAIGFLWALLEPLGLMVIYAVVFSFIIKLAIPDYPVFLICGLIPWIYFSKSLIYCTESVIKDRHLVKKIYFPREVLPIASVLARFVNFAISLTLLLVFLVFCRGLDPLILLWLVPVIVVQTVLSIGLALIFSSLNVYFQDVGLLLDFLVTIWLYLTPVFYSITMVPEKFKLIYILNPAVGIISSYKDILFYKKAPLTLEFCISAFLSVIVLIMGAKIFFILNKRIGELV